jgi:hypothetical protein
VLRRHSPLGSSGGDRGTRVQLNYGLYSTKTKIDLSADSTATLADTPQRQKFHPGRVGRQAGGELGRDDRASQQGGVAVGEHWVSGNCHAALAICSSWTWKHSLVSWLTRRLALASMERRSK